MELFCDLHIHTALSPCGDNDMTPNNIVNMAKLKGLDVIAITDHNTCENSFACIEAGGRIGVRVIPGMELQTREDIHAVCLFDNMESAAELQKIVYEHLPPVKNKPLIFGEQYIMNSNDDIIGIMDKMLLSSTDISFDEAFKIVNGLDGIFIPAHIDRDSFGILQSIGFIPDYLDIRTLECYSDNKIDDLVKMGIVSKNYRFIKSSDAHYLHQILEREEALRINLKEKDITPRSILNWLMV